MRVAVAMSGGVDSAVAAALLVDQGVDVFGVMMRLWVEEGRVNRCCSPSDVNGARQVASRLGIPFYVVDMKAVFREHIVSFFLDGYAQGVTPNPCIECNRTIRWTHLLKDALSLGATHLATGHYARVQARGGEWVLLRGIDPHKDQSYVLSVLGQAEMAHAVFPLGEHTKPEVRETRAPTRAARCRAAGKPGFVFPSRRRLPRFPSAAHFRRPDAGTHPERGRGSARRTHRVGRLYDRAKARPARVVERPALRRRQGPIHQRIDRGESIGARTHDLSHPAGRLGIRQAAGGDVPGRSAGALPRRPGALSGVGALGRNVRCGARPAAAGRDARAIGRFLPGRRLPSAAG